MVLKFNLSYKTTETTIAVDTTTLEAVAIDDWMLSAYAIEVSIYKIITIQTKDKFTIPINDIISLEYNLYSL